MSPFKRVSLVVLLAGSFGGLPGYAQEPIDVESSGVAGQAVRSQGATEVIGGPMAPAVPVDTPVVPFSWTREALEGWPWADSTAGRAARIDPGILIYTKPPPGTDMPTLKPPEHVDPDMIWPGEP